MSFHTLLHYPKWGIILDLLLKTQVKLLFFYVLAIKFSTV